MSSLNRTTFETSRENEFFTERELQMQIGAPKAQWPLALVKELLDNGLDACEAAGQPPKLRVTVGPEGDWVDVADNGPGLPPDVLRRSLDYRTRISDKIHYVSPTRGQQGNALKCIWAAPFVASGRDTGHVEVHTGGTAYHVHVRHNQIRGVPDVHLTETPSDVKTGTTVRMHWPEVARYLNGSPSADSYNASGTRLSLEALAEQYAMFNPHLHFTVERPGCDPWTHPPTDPSWSAWGPSDPTSSHWYTHDAFATLVAAMIARERKQGGAPDDGMTVRELIGTFDGLTSTRKQSAILDATGMAQTRLADLATDTDIDQAAVRALHAAMNDAARPVRSQRLGALGKTHMEGRLAALCDPETTLRKCRYGKEGIPFIVEVGFGEAIGSSHPHMWGVNGTPMLRNPFGEAVAHRLAEARLAPADPVVLAVHLRIPQARFTDRGKTQVDLPREAAQRLDDSIRLATKRWTKHKKKQRRALQKWTKRNEKRIRERKRTGSFPSIKAACFHFMPEAYQKASDNNSLPANARQIMYAIRPLVLEAMSRFYKNDQTFTQDVLPEYLRDHPDLDWDVIYDSRGRFVEPHTGRDVPLGTLEVRNYLQDWTATAPPVEAPQIHHRAPTVGPLGRYAGALFVEKEGFTQVLQRAQIARRFDVALFSTKGQTVTASRRLAEALAQEGLPLFVLHDFDKAGLEIRDTFQSDTDRYRYDIRPTVIGLGLRLSDVEAMDLDGEAVSYRMEKDPRTSLRSCGASEAECRFLRSDGHPGAWKGQRVELNAMTSRQLVDLVERKLEAHGVEKVVPDRTTLREAWTEMHQLRTAKRLLHEVRETADAEDAPPLPPNIRERLSSRIDGTAAAWDDALWTLTEDA